MLSKRLFDLFFTLPGLVLLAPVFVFVAVAVKLDSPGPVFFRQVRVGRHGKLFYIYKFRTMVEKAEQLGRQITVGEDSRITNVGKILRKYKIDELPQLFNVVAGDMSLVGPRPEVPRYVELYPPDIREKVLSVLPGITDFAAIEYKDENAILGAAADPDKEYIEKIMPVKLSYYLRYAEERSLWMDFILILRTLKAVFS